MDNVTVSPLTDMSEYMNNDELSIFPNPTTGILNILIPENMENSNILIYNSLGSEVGSFNIPSNSRSFTTDLKPYGNGIFFIHVLSEGRSVVKKVIVK